MRQIILTVPSADEVEAASGYDASLTAEERVRLFQEWADGHPKDSPLLSDEAISREALYAGTGGDHRIIETFAVLSCP